VVSRHVLLPAGKPCLEPGQKVFEFFHDACHSLTVAIMWIFTTEIL
jgi:hypothetical protein